MKKQLFRLALACSLSLMGMEQFGAPASVRNTKPSLMAILKRKYIDRQPLTKDQQEYLRKAKKPAIAAGLVALGIGATAAGILAYRGKKRTPQQVIPTKTKEEYLKNITVAKGQGNVMFLLTDLANDYFNGNLVSAQQYVEEQSPGLMEKKGLRRANVFDR